MLGVPVLSMMLRRTSHCESLPLAIQMMEMLVLSIAEIAMEGGIPE